MDNYFSQDYKSSARIPTEQLPTLEENDSNQVSTLIRSSNSGDKIYFVKNNTKHWVTSPEVLRALGYDFGQEKEVDKMVMQNLLSGEPIRMTNVNEYILPVEEVREEPTLQEVVEKIAGDGIDVKVEEEVIEPTQEIVDNAKISDYFTVIIPCTLTSEAVPQILKYVETLQKFFSGEVITVVKNQCNYREYSPKFGHKVIECESLAEGVERAGRVAKGTTLLADEIA